MVPSRIEWAGKLPGRLATVVTHLTVGFVAALLLVLAFLVGSVILSGASEFTVLFLVVLVVVGPFSLLCLLYALRYGEATEKRALAAHLPSVRLRWVVAALPVGFVALYGILLAPWLLLGYIVVGLFVWTVANTGRMGGAFDTETGELVREGQGQTVEHDLNGLRSFRAVRLGPYVVCLLRHRRGMVLDEPFGLVVPASVFDQFRPALEQQVETSETSDSQTSTPERAVLVGFGLLFVGVAALLTTTDVPRSTAITWLVAAWGLLFVLLGWVA